MRGPPAGLVPIADPQVVDSPGPLLTQGGIKIVLSIIYQQSRWRGL